MGFTKSFSQQNAIFTEYFSFPISQFEALKLMIF